MLPLYNLKVKILHLGRILFFLGNYSSVVEYLIVIQKVMGSIPINYQYYKRRVGVPEAYRAHDPKEWFDSNARSN